MLFFDATTSQFYLTSITGEWAATNETWTEDQTTTYEYDYQDLWRETYFQSTWADPFTPLVPVTGHYVHFEIFLSYYVNGSHTTHQLKEEGSIDYTLVNHSQSSYDAASDTWVIAETGTFDQTERTKVWIDTTGSSSDSGSDAIVIVGDDNGSPAYSFSNSWSSTSNNYNYHFSDAKLTTHREWSTNQTYGPDTLEFDVTVYSFGGGSGVVEYPATPNLSDTWSQTADFQQTITFDGKYSSKLTLTENTPDGTRMTVIDSEKKISDGGDITWNESSTKSVGSLDVTVVTKDDTYASDVIKEERVERTTTIDGESDTFVYVTYTEMFRPASDEVAAGEAAELPPEPFDWLGWTHTALDVVGFVDPTGVADGLNAVLYLAEGDYENATISFISALPGGDGAKLAKVVKQGINKAKKLNEAYEKAEEIQEVAGAVGNIAQGKGGPGKNAGGNGGKPGANAAPAQKPNQNAPKPGEQPGVKPNGQKPPSVRHECKTDGGCFAAGTPILTQITEDGHLISVPVEQLQVGDIILSRHEDQPDTPPRPRKIEAVFQRESLLLELRIAGQIIRTTAEHPFFVQGKGWTASNELAINDQVLTHAGQWLSVEAVVAVEQLHTVYNCRVEEDHTYFVGHTDWDWAVWVHNSYGSNVKSKNYNTNEEGRMLRAEAHKFRQSHPDGANRYRNVATARVEVNGKERIVRFINSPGTEHSEDRLIQWYKDMNARGHNVKVQAVYT